MQVIAVSQRKGGTGKTTLARTLAEYAVLKKGVRVLLIDYDTQCNLSHLYLAMETPPAGGTRPPLHPDYEPDSEEWTGRSSSADLFYGNAVYPYPAQSVDIGEGLDILPGDSSHLVRVEEQEQTRLREAVENRTREFVQAYREDLDVSGDESYDLMIIDTAPSASPLTRSALRAATHLLIPVELEEQCVEGLHEMLTMWRSENMVRTPDASLNIIGIQPNKVKTRRLVHREFLAALRANTATARYLSPVLIPDRAEYAERDVALARPRSIFKLRPSNSARQAAEAFGDWAWERIHEEVL